MTTLDLNTLFKSYGWQLAIVALIGMAVVYWLKKPINWIITKKCPEDKASAVFDTFGFLLGVAIAVLLGCLYTFIGKKLNWLSFSSAKEEALTYITNLAGTWAWQIFYLNVWKKLGAKKICAIIGRAFKSLWLKLLDKNKDGSIDFAEAAQVVTGLVSDGKLSIDDVLAAVAAVVPETVTETVMAIVDEAGDDAQVDMSQSIERLGDIAQSVVSAIPQENLNSLATTLVKKAEDKAKELVDNTITASVDPDVTSTPTKPVKPTIQF